MAVQVPGLGAALQGAAVPPYFARTTTTVGDPLPGAGALMLRSALMPLQLVVGSGEPRLGEVLHVSAQVGGTTATRRKVALSCWGAAAAEWIDAALINSAAVRQATAPRNRLTRVRNTTDMVPQPRTRLPPIPRVYVDGPAIAGREREKAGLRRTE